MRVLAEATLQLLVAIAKAVDNEVTNIERSRPGGIVPWKYEPFNPLGLSPRQNSRAFKSLLERDYIKGNLKDIKITKKGRLAIVAHSAREKGKKSKWKWDGKWRIVVFDVPEFIRKDRDFVRTHLKLLGFKEFQKSVWISPWDITNEVKEFFRLCDRRPSGNIRIATIERIDYDKDLRKRFGV